MGIPYTGSRTSALNDPAGAPEGGRAPQATIPLDGEPVNASTFIPGYKSAMDWLDWLRRPLAKAAAWADPIKKYQTAAGHSRHVIDHLGFTSGNFTSYQQLWGYDQSLPSSPPVQHYFNDGWQVQGSNHSGHQIDIELPAPLVATKYALHRRLRMICAGTTGAGISVLTPTYTSFHADSHAVFEALVMLDAADPGLTISIGLMGSSGGYAWFRKAAGIANWSCQTYGGSLIGTASAALPPTTTGFQRLRVEYHGANVADNGVAAVCFYINGVLVRRTTNDLPTVQGCRGGVFQNHAGVGDLTMHLGPCRFSHNHFGTDV